MSVPAQYPSLVGVASEHVHDSPSVLPPPDVPPELELVLELFGQSA